MAVLTGGQTGAILWAQLRALRNVYFRSARGAWSWFTGLMLLAWYGLWVAGAITIGVFASDPGELPALARYLPGGLLLVFGYWQFIPVMLVSSGLSLDLARLLAYPVPHRRLFAIEVLLRLSTALEMVIITAGLGVGLALNPALPLWAPFPLAVFTLFNLLLSAGMRDLLSRLMARKYFREMIVLALVLLAATPQILLRAGTDSGTGVAAGGGFGWWWPWSATASLNAGRGGVLALGLLGFWTLAAWWFGRRQFERTLRFDAAAARSAGRGRSAGAVSDHLPRLVTALFRDPMAAIVEKEFRILIRSPRFRLLFFMGFSFGLMIWLPLAMSGESDSVTRAHYLTLVCAYALLLLGDVCFWNSFGMDRAAAATWFVTPVPMTTVIIARNVATSVFIVLEVGVVCLVCFLLRMPVTAGLVLETFAVIAVLSVFLYAFGNLISVRYPRPVDPAQSWRNTSSGRIQILLLFAYPILGSPVLLAYGARYAFDEELAFYAVLLADLIIAAITYTVALESAARYAERHSEQIVQALSQSEGPIGA